MIHPWKELIEELRIKNLTQKDFSLMLWKRVSELNELIKGKRNITIQWDILLSQALWTPEKYWIHKQIDYDYAIIKKELDLKSSLPIKVKTVVSSIKEEDSVWDNLDLKSSESWLSTSKDSDVIAEELLNTELIYKENLEEDLSTEKLKQQKYEKLRNIFIKF